MPHNSPSAAASRARRPDRRQDDLLLDGTTTIIDRLHAAEAEVRRLRARISHAELNRCFEEARRLRDAHVLADRLAGSVMDSIEREQAIVRARIADAVHAELVRAEFHRIPNTF